MSLFSCLKRNNKKSYSLIFNIGSGSVSGGIADFTEKEGVNMSYFAKEIFPFQPEVASDKHQELMKSTLVSLARKIQTEGLKKIAPKKDKNVSFDRAFYVFSSPWSVSQTKTIRIKESKAIKITDNYLNHAIEEQEKQFQVDIAKTGKIIERKIIQIKVNGYTIDRPASQLANDLEVSVLFTAVPEEILHAVDSAVSQAFNIKNHWCHSLTLVLFTNIRNLFPQKEDFIHIDVSEELTDISVIKDNIIASTASIPFGHNHFIRELANLLKVTEEIASSMISIHSKKDNNELANLKLAVTMDSAAKGWLAQIFKVLDSLKEKIYVPESVFLVVSGDLILFLKEKLQKQDFKVFLVENKKIRSTATIDDIMFKLTLMFLDNLYKI